MTHVVYHIVKHAEGWAYKVGDTFSETFTSHDKARHAARAAATHHAEAGRTVGIVFEDASGQWREELADGSDRPFVTVEG
jgi:hypothetical protein